MAVSGVGSSAMQESAVAWVSDVLLAGYATARNRVHVGSLARTNSKMSPTAPTTCTHERGPGTTMCLRCRHDQFQATQRRRAQMLMRVIGVACVVGIIGIAGVAGALTLRGGDAASITQTSAGNVALKQEGKAKPRTERLPRPLTPTPVRASAVVAAAQPADSETPAAPAPLKV